jgi:phosphoinositide-3-kinase, regulatory subunit 4
LPTFLNPLANWELRAATFSKIVPVMIFVGNKPLENMFEIILQTIYDEQELVVEKAINAFAAFCKEGLITKKKNLTKILKVCVPLICHPNQWIRHGVVSLISSICENRKKNFSKVDVNCFLLPQLKEFLFYPILKVTQKTLLQAVKKPIPRELFENACKIAKESYEISFTCEQLKNFKNEFVNCLRERMSDNTEEKKAIIETIILMSDYFKEHQKNRKNVREDQDKIIHFQFLNVNNNTPVYNERQNVDSIKDFNKEMSNRELPKTIKENYKDFKIEENLNLSEEEYQKKYNFFNSVNTFVPNVVIRESNRGSLSDVNSVGLNVNERRKNLKFDSFNGTLVAHFNEHSASVNQICVSDDCQFFASGSSDGTVKIWDCQRLKTNVTNRSRLTCKINKGKILCVSMLEKSHTVISGSDQGNIHIFNVEYEKKTGNQAGIIKYNSITTTDYIDRSAQGAILQIEYFNKKGFFFFLILFGSFFLISFFFL